VCLPGGDNVFEAGARVATDSELASMAVNGTNDAENLMVRRLVPDVKYVVHVKATAAAGVSSQFNTDGFVIDCTPR